MNARPSGRCRTGAFGRTAMKVDLLHSFVERGLLEALRLNLFFSFVYFAASVAVLVAIAFR
jgi:hypothetical protein